MKNLSNLISFPPSALLVSVNPCEVELFRSVSKYVINSIYRMERKIDKTNKTKMSNKLNLYMSENINSETS